MYFERFKGIFGWQIGIILCFQVLIWPLCTDEKEKGWNLVIVVVVIVGGV